MKQVPLFRVLKVLATICLSLTILPVLMGLCASFGIRGDGSFWSGQILLLTLSSTLGLLWKTLLHPHIVKSCGLGLILANFLSALLALLFALLEMLLFFPLLPQPLQFYRFTYFPFGASGIGAAFLCGSLAAERQYGNILTNYSFGILTGADCLCVFLAWCLKWEISNATLAICYLLTAGVSALCRNQSGIDFLMQRRKHDLSHLPVKMRWYSLALTTGGFGLVLAGFLFRNQIAGGIHWFLNVLKEGISALLRYLTSGEGSKETPLESGGSSQLERLPPYEEPGNGSLFWTIFGWLMLVGAIIGIYYYRREIAAFFRTIWLKLKTFLAKLFLHRGKAARSNELTGSYEDDVVSLPRIPAAPAEKKQKPYDLRLWRKEYRAYQRLPEGSEKLRKGYRLILLCFLLKRIPLLPSDTPEEIFKKAESRVPSDLLRKVTDSYQKTRYGELTPNVADLTALSQLLEDCCRKEP